MQSIVSIIVFLLLSILLGTITTRFISLAEEKNGKDFSIKEYIYSFKDFRLNLKYVIIFFILYLLVVKTVINLVIYTPVILALILGFVLDIKFMIIPDTSSILMCISGMMNLTVNFSKEALLSSILSMITGFILLFLPDFLFRKIVKKEGFGMGDMKLLASIGLFTGLKSVLVIFVISIILSSICGVAIIIYKKIKENTAKKDKENIKDMYIPFGPYIIISTLIMLVIPAVIFTSTINYLTRIIVKKMI